MRETNKGCGAELNRFKGLVEFPTIHYIKLANILCQDDSTVDRYIKDYYNPKFEQWEVINSLQKFKRDILSERTGVEEYREKIKNCIEVGNWEYLWVLLQNLFLEPLVWLQVLDVVDLIHKCVDENDIMKWYEKGKKILAMTTFDAEYIKSVTSK